jgi:hypothetical protein
MKKWFIALLFVFACLPVVAIKAAPPQTYIHLDYEIIDGVYYDVGDGVFDGAKSYWACSNKIQIPKNVDKLYFSGWHTHFVLFFSDKTYIGFYYDDEFVFDLTFTAGTDEKMLGTYNYSNDLIHVLEVPTNATHIVLQTCWGVEALALDDYMEFMPIDFNERVKPLIYYPAPADTASNITFNLMPMLMIMIVIAGVAGGLIMITKKSKR